jgi:retron-type reverse transcriptase
MDATAELLQRFLADNDCSRDALLQFVQNSDWKRPDVVSTLKVGLRKRADSTIRAWGVLSKQLACTPSTLLRNLIACAEEPELAVYSILLRYEQKTAESSLGGSLKDVLDILHNRDSELSLVQSLVLTDRKPPIGSFTRTLKTDLERLFFARLWSALEVEDPSGQDLNEIFSRITIGPLGSVGDICISVFAKLRKARNWPAFINKESLDELPTSVRRAALNDRSMLTVELRQILDTDPYFHPDAPAVLARADVLESALRCIRNKEFADVSVARLAEDKELFASNRGKVRSALKTSPPYWSKPTASSPRLRKALRNLSTLPEAVAMLALSAPASQRHKYFAAAIEDVGREAASLCSVSSLSTALAETASRTARTSFLNILDEPKLRYAVFKQCFADRYFRPRVKYQDLLVEWFSIGPIKDLVKTVQIDASTMPIFADVQDEDGKFLELLDATVNRLPAEIVFELLTPSRRRRYVSTDSARANELISDLVSRLCEKKAITGWASPRRFSSFARWFPRSAPDVLRQLRTDHAFRSVCKIPKIWKLGDDVVDQMMQLKDSDGSPLWHAYLTRWSAKSRPIPTAMRRYLESRDDLLKLAFELAPIAFWRAARSRYVLEELLKAALRYPKLAVDLEKQTSREQLRATIPWVRETWNTQPTLSAAYEVAVSFSLADAGFLVALGKELRPPFDNERCGTAFDSYYRTYELPKKAGGKRTITVPSTALKRLQRRLLDNGFDEIPLHPSAMGFRKGRSIKDNAEKHTGKEVVANVDIHQFFPSTGYRLILRACRKLCDGGISPRAARLVAEICSYGGSLPTGAPTSPAIGNVVLRAADQAIGTVADRAGVTYTRYADDLTFSGGDAAIAILPFAREVLIQLDYQLDDKKTNLYRRGRRQLVTGLVVNEKPNLPRRLRRKLRAAVHSRLSGKEPYWHDQPMLDSVLMGHIAFLFLTQPEEATRYRENLREVLSQ